MGKSILLLEDDPVYREVIGYYLEQAFSNDEIKYVSCKSEFEQKIKEEQPALLIADVLIPNRQGEQEDKRIGFETMKMIDQNIPIIAISSLGEEITEELENFIGRKEIPFFRKPFDTDRLIAKVKELLNE
jgi:DNA-binding response OmpR family regulator